MVECLFSVKYSDAIYSGKITASSAVLNEAGVSMVSSLIYSFIYNRDMKEGDTIYLGTTFLSIYICRKFLQVVETQSLTYLLGMLVR